MQELKLLPQEFFEFYFRYPVWAVEGCSKCGVVLVDVIPVLGELREVTVY
jgi:hypothetical protein